MQFKYCSLVEIPWSGQLFEHRVQLVFKVASTLAFSNYISIPNSRLRTRNTICIHFWVIDESFKKILVLRTTYPWKHGDAIAFLHLPQICEKSGSFWNSLSWGLIYNYFEFCHFSFFRFFFGNGVFEKALVETFGCYNETNHKQCLNRHF